MAVFCPKIGETDIAWRKMLRLFGRDGAYGLAKANGGYSLEKTPNGNPSILLKDLSRFTLLEGDEALLVKAHTLTKEFKDWYGESFEKDGEPVVFTMTDIKGEEYYFSTAKDAVALFPVFIKKAMLKPSKNLEIAFGKAKGIYVEDGNNIRVKLKDLSLTRMILLNKKEGRINGLLPSLKITSEETQKFC